ncbi:acetylgalactosaminyl-O-glycosyl-glycoprotein beta-1,3-N-acetylglucosaminyltransferase-like isoform X2 [Carettochelys insculpta]|uniref:acetylgalactosaminyl-O-glycosyl-glycoprotein beta-1,3-N-acetylglucosaminyltransferase-like isoform X2 n=1 Tax=Carettochelys insculpta TaxID=44489 RepID=UPI003EBF8F1C
MIPRRVQMWCWLVWILLSGGTFWLIYNVGNKQRRTPRAGPSPSPSPGPGPGPDTVELSDGTYTFRLDYAAFQAEFPHLQSYQCQELIPEKGICTRSLGQLLLLLAVKSHPGSTARRATARRTWARPWLLRGYWVQPIFLVAVSPNPRHMALLRRESVEFRDVVLWDFNESHHNLSLKMRCFLHWAEEHCRQADFLFVASLPHLFPPPVDDDEFVNPPSLVTYLHQTPNASHAIHGNIQRHAVVMRKGKYAISHALYPQDKYPFFASAGGFFLPWATIPALVAAAQHLPVFPLDDVYVGFLALGAGLQFQQSNRFWVFGMKDELSAPSEGPESNGEVSVVLESPPGPSQQASPSAEH